MATTDGLDHRQWLVRVLSAKQARNPLYSLRSFASYLKVSPTTLSQVISGKRPLSRRLARSLIERLDLKDADADRLLRASERARRGGRKAAKDGGPEPYVELADDVFASIGDWKHYAILALSQHAHNRGSAAWIARQLGIAPEEAEESFSRLLRLGIIELTPDGFRQTTAPLATIAGARTSEAVRTFHRDNLKLAEATLETEPVGARDFSATTFLASSAQLEEAKELIRKFRRELGALLERPDGDRVYCLSIQLFPYGHRIVPAPLDGPRLPS